MKVRDPDATSREGWIYEEHITAVERPKTTEAELATDHEGALASETDGASEPTTRSFKSKKRTQSVQDQKISENLRVSKRDQRRSPSLQEVVSIR